MNEWNGDGGRWASTWDIAYLLGVIRTGWKFWHSVCFYELSARKGENRREVSEIFRAKKIIKKTLCGISKRVFIFVDKSGTFDLRTTVISARRNPYQPYTATRQTQNTLCNARPCPRVCAHCVWAKQSNQTVIIILFQLYDINIQSFGEIYWAHSHDLFPLCRQLAQWSALLGGRTLGRPKLLTIQMQTGGERLYIIAMVSCVRSLDVRSNADCITQISAVKLLIPLWLRIAVDDARTTPHNALLSIEFSPLHNMDLFWSCFYVDYRAAVHVAGNISLRVLVSLFVFFVTANKKMRRGQLTFAAIVYDSF